MVTILILYLLLIFILFGLVLLLIRRNIKNNIFDTNEMYYDEDGNHRYYERSLIDKLHYMRKHPDCGHLRSFRGLFNRYH